MKVSFKITLYLIITFGMLLSSGTGVRAQVSGSDGKGAGSVPAKIRLPDPDKIEKLQADKDFHYYEEVVQGDTFWSRLKHRISKFLSKIFYQGQSTGIWEVLFYVLLVVAITFFIIKLLKVDVTGLFGRTSVKTEMPYQVMEENIHELDLSSLIEEAITKHEFRKAVRLLYLQSLKELTDSNYISWKPGKTNRSYISEIQQPRIRQEFEQLTGMFEYVWYGGAGLGATLFENARLEFEQFNNLLKQHA